MLSEGALGHTWEVSSRLKEIWEDHWGEVTLEQTPEAWVGII